VARLLGLCACEFECLLLYVVYSFGYKEILRQHPPEAHTLVFYSYARERVESMHTVHPASQIKNL
jgi:hypothetical protein